MQQMWKIIHSKRKLKPFEDQDSGQHEDHISGQHEDRACLSTPRVTSSGQEEFTPRIFAECHDGKKTT